VTQEKLKNIDLSKSKVPEEAGLTNQLLDLFQKDNGKKISLLGKKRQTRSKWSHFPENDTKLTEEERRKKLELKSDFRVAQRKKAAI
jgi:hypothetical protein